ncbi:MAG TPA: heavy metal-binding domain-containing protein [Prolixibacteraceae bacterium]|nr:heavy metal-binding domain-containing protein [Prolixibacteraceae bacterium]
MKISNEVIGGTDQRSENHSCCGGSSHQHHDDNSANSGKGYQCPMKCEGDKTYDSPGICPVCNMHLAQVK